MVKGNFEAITGWGNVGRFGITLYPKKKIKFGKYSYRLLYAIALGWVELRYYPKIDVDS